MCPIASVEPWNEWSTVDTSGTLNPTICTQICIVASDPDVAQLIIWFRFETFCREKAYDTTWKYTILKYLYGFGLRGRLPKKKFNYSRDGCTLFLVKINSITSI